MTAIVSVETALLVILVVLVAGLLRSHAEILRRLEAGGTQTQGAVDLDVRTPPPTPERVPGAPAPAISGPTPDGDAIALDFSSSASGMTLLAFLTSGCSTCAGFWSTLAEPRLPAGVQVVVVAHGAERERPRKLRELAPPGIPVVMSSQAWTEYAVPGSPYFVLVDGSIQGEGAATDWTALSSLVSDAVEDQRDSSGAGRADAIDSRLAAAGIGPDHPSLYPAGRPT